MKNRKLIVVMLVLAAVVTVGRGAAFAEDTDPAGVAGCAAVAVDPSASLEMQQTVCGAAERNESSSCAASGHGVCSSPKLNDTMPDGTHCICISEEEQEEETEEVS